MRIALSTSVLQRGKSGVGQYVLALSRALLDMGDDLQLVLLALEEDVPLFNFAKGRAEIVTVSEKYRRAVRNILWHHSALPSILRQSEIDVLHVPSYRRMVGWAPCARVATIHDLAPFHVRGKYDPARMFYGRVVVKHLARRQDEIIAISRNTAKDIERFFGIPVSRQNVIHNGIDHVRFQPGDVSAASAEVAIRWKLDAPYFLYISRLEHPAKNHVRLFEAFNRFKARTGSPWLLALGGGDWPGADLIRSSAACSPHHRDIRFLGFVPDEALTALYRAAGTMVYPSLFEGFGFPPIEAMACGCPVLCSTRGALAEVVGEAAEILDPEDMDGMADGLTRLASDAARREELRRMGLSHASRFDWRINATDVLSVYQKAIARRARRA